MITDWDDAYANGDHIADAATYPELWATQSAKFRDELSSNDRARLDIAYGDASREKYDLFLPPARPRAWSSLYMAAIGRRLTNPAGRIWPGVR